MKRIVAIIAADQFEAAGAFYGDARGATIGMDMGWITTFAADRPAPPQLGIAAGGCAGTPVPGLSIEVDDLTDVRRKMKAAGFRVEYGPVIELSAVARFCVRDPFGRLVNSLAHQ